MRGKGRGPFSTISLPTPLVQEVEKIVKEIGYWPDKTDFIREAVIEKLERYKENNDSKRRIGSPSE